jgi:hypothetical protein
MTQHFPKNPEEGRSNGAIHFESQDGQAIAAEFERIGAKSVLEFGPGDSTQAFLDMGIEKVVTCEYIDKWLKVAQDRFKKDKRVRVLKFTDEVPVVVEGLDPDERFDIAFVDAPKGFPPVRKVHPGIEDCSRLNTVLFALSRCPVVLLHDALRPLERATLGRVWATGMVDIALLPNRLGMARITLREQKPHGPDPQDAKELGSSPPRPKPKRRRKPVNKRPDRLDLSGVENAPSDVG